MRRRQRGVALITIMLVVAVATILGVEIASEQHFAILRGAHSLEDEQARQYALGGEELARQVLHADFVKQPGKDSNFEPWAAKDLHYEFEGGEVLIHIEDLQGRLNVNRVAYGNEIATSRARLQKLLADLGLDPTWLPKIVDWIDADEAREPGGAEDFDYLGTTPPHRTAGTMLTDPSELRMLLDMDNETWAKLRPYLTALPDPATPVNINTASAEVLASLSTAITPQMAETLMATRDSLEGYDSVNAFLQDPALAGTAVPNTGLGVQSGFFEVRIRARFNDRFAYLTSVIQRNLTDGRLRVISRDLGKRVAGV